MQIHVPSMSNFAHSDTLTQTYRWPWFPSGPRKTRCTSSTLKDKHTPFLSWFYRVCGWLFLFFLNQSLCTVMEQTQVKPAGNSRYTDCTVTWRAMLLLGHLPYPPGTPSLLARPFVRFHPRFHSIKQRYNTTLHCRNDLKKPQTKERHTLYRGCLMHQHYQNSVWSVEFNVVKANEESVKNHWSNISV